MAVQNEDLSMALFCDFENIALGVRDAQYEKFDIKPILEKLLLKGSIVVKKAYCDWERYKAHKAAMHEANFELIEIPHVRQSGKNSADIRMVVDALDLCYTKAHLNTFVVISGDSDFSPLVSKLRENAKHVIGVGVKQSTSDLLIANCDEFIYYDDLVREREAKRSSRPKENQRRSPEEELKRREELEKRRSQGIELAVATLEDLLRDRADDERVWASVLKEALKRRNPGFNESYFGFRAFGNLLEEAAARGLLEFGRDEKSGAYVRRRPVVSSEGGVDAANGSLLETIAETVVVVGDGAAVGVPVGPDSPSEEYGAQRSPVGDESQPSGHGGAQPSAPDEVSVGSEAATVVTVSRREGEAGDAVGTLALPAGDAGGERRNAAPPAASEKPRRRRSRVKPATEAAAREMVAVGTEAVAAAQSTPTPEAGVDGAETAVVARPRRRSRKPKTASNDGEI